MAGIEVMSINMSAIAVGTILGIALSVLLTLRAVAIVVACTLALAPLYGFYLGGHELILGEAQRLAGLLSTGQSSGFISGLLIGKFLVALGRGLSRRQ